MTTGETVSNYWDNVPSRNFVELTAGQPLLEADQAARFFAARGPIVQKLQLGDQKNIFYLIDMRNNLVDGATPDPVAIDPVAPGKRSQSYDFALVPDEVLWLGSQAATDPKAVSAEDRRTKLHFYAIKMGEEVWVGQELNQGLTRFGEDTQVYDPQSADSGLPLKESASKCQSVIRAEQDGSVYLADLDSDLGTYIWRGDMELPAEKPRIVPKTSMPSVKVKRIGESAVRREAVEEIAEEKAVPLIFDDEPEEISSVKPRRRHNEVFDQDEGEIIVATEESDEPIEPIIDQSSAPQEVPIAEIPRKMIRISTTERHAPTQPLEVQEQVAPKPKKVSRWSRAKEFLGILDDDDMEEGPNNADWTRHVVAGLNKESAHPREESAVALKRKHGQDSFIKYDKVGLYGVFDGVGGNIKGAEAAQMASRIISTQIERYNPEGIDPEEAMEALGMAVGICHTQIKNKLKGYNPNKGIEEIAATTATIAWVLPVPGKEKERRVVWASVGDSRLYHFSKKNGLVKISADQARGNATRALGGSSSNFDPDRLQKGSFTVSQGDLLLLVTDGVCGNAEGYGYDYVDDSKLEEVVRRHPDPVSLANILVDIENEIQNLTGGTFLQKDDDRTAVVASVI